MRSTVDQRIFCGQEHGTVNPVALHLALRCKKACFHEALKYGNEANCESW
jgi:hypothetical protein